LFGWNTVQRRQSNKLFNISPLGATILAALPALDSITLTRGPAMFAIAARYCRIPEFTVTCRRFMIKWISLRSVPRGRLWNLDMEIATFWEGFRLFMVSFKKYFWALITSWTEVQASPRGLPWWLQSSGEVLRSFANKRMLLPIRKGLKCLLRNHRKI